MVPSSLSALKLRVMVSGEVALRNQAVKFWDALDASTKVVSRISMDMIVSEHLNAMFRHIMDSNKGFS